MVRHCLMALGCLALGTALQAKDPEFGVQAGLAIPMGDLDKLVGGSMGLQFGAHATFDLQGGHALKPRIEYSTFNGKGNSGSGPVIGCDWAYHFDRRVGHGGFIGAGAGLLFWKESGDHWSDSTNTVQLSVLGGYHFNRQFTGTLRYATWNHSGYSDSAFTMGVEIHF